jgi:hypothetical protein
MNTQEIVLFYAALWTAVIYIIVLMCGKKKD